MRIMKGIEQRRNFILIAFLLIVGVIVAPTLISFSITGEDTPEREIPTYDDLNVYVSHSPVVIFSTDIIKVRATYTLVAAAGICEDRSFILSEDGIAQGKYYLSTGLVIEYFFDMIWDVGESAFIGFIPAQASGVTVEYTVTVTSGDMSGTSGMVSYFVSYETIPSEEDTTDPLTGPGYNIPPLYIMNGVILDDGTELTWPEFMGATIWGTVHFSITFVEGGDRISYVKLVAQRIDGYGSGTWWWGISAGDKYTWEFDWNTLTMPDGEYVMTMEISYWTTDTPPVEGGGDGSGTAVLQSAFGFSSGSGFVSALLENEVIVAVLIVAVLIVGGFFYFKTKTRMMKRGKQKGKRK